MPNTFEAAVGMSAEDFFLNYWGKKPLFVKGALPTACDLISPDDLAGLACEVEAARLIQHNADDGSWQVGFGPFDESDFAILPESDWTLLVQEVDRMDDSVNGLLDVFRCFPNWRLDDIMVSYAVPGGTVGAHVDQYDVFLIQGHGTRRWEIGNSALKNPAFVEDLELRILREFVSEEVFDAEPGDLLYLPPMFAHHGVATSECITLSVGFRKPLVAEMVASYLSEVLTKINPEHQLKHELRSPTANPGLLDFDTLESVRSVFRALLYDEESVDDWFGRYITAPARGGDLWTDDDAWGSKEIAGHLSTGGSFLRRAPSLCTYQNAPGGSVRLYIVGEVNVLPSGSAGFAELLCGGEVMNKATLGEFADNETAQRLLVSLIKRGVLSPVE